MMAVIAFGVSSAAHAQDQGHGKVTFTGSIIDAPCSISPESIDQTVELGQIAKHELIGGGESTPRNFSIGLENCLFPTDDNGNITGKNKLTLTFTGSAGTAGENETSNKGFGITGSAKGASVMITDGAGKEVVPGSPIPEILLQAGQNTLSFSAYLKGDHGAKEDTLKEGEFQSVADFTLAYN